MERLHLGITARKTGIHAPWNLTRDKYGMEDLNAFFSDSDSPPPAATLRNPSRRPHTDAPFQHVARRIDFAEAANYDNSPIHPAISPLLLSNLRSPLPEYNLSDRRLSSPLLSRNDSFDARDDYDNYDVDSGSNFDHDNDVDPLSPEPSINDAAGDSFFGGDPLPDPASGPLFIEDSENSQLNAETAPPKRHKRAATVGAQSLTPKLRKRQAIKRRGPLELEESASGSDSDRDPVAKRSLPASRTIPPSTPKTKSTRTAKAPSSYTVSYPRPGSALPSPPPEGLRRSKRTRIAPLAFWRNERIVYGRAHDNIDPDTTLAQDIVKIPLQEIESVVHCPEPEYKMRNSGSRKLSGPRLHAGSEWMVLRALDAEIIRDGDSVEQRIAFTSHGAEFEPVIGPDDDYEIATLYSNGDEQKASGLLEFKEDGRKLPRNSGDCLITFFVVKGELQVLLNETKFVVLRGCSFEIPTGNLYSFENIANGDSRLFFVQMGAFEQDRIADN